MDENVLSNSEYVAFQRGLSEFPNIESLYRYIVYIESKFLIVGRELPFPTVLTHGELETISVHF